MLTTIVERLEMRRMSIPDYKAWWCSSCLRVVLYDTRARKTQYEVISAGVPHCTQKLKFGTMDECIDALRATQRGAAP